jgi:glutathionylspermidine synthase
MKMTVFEEPRALVLNDFAAHSASGLAQIQEMRRGTATYKGVPIKFGYLPKYFSQEGFAKLKEDLEHTWRILVRVIGRYLDDPDYRRLFGFSPELEQMILRRPAYRTLLPVCRLDIFLNEETGAFKFCEFNADGSSAMNDNAELNRTYRNTLLCREMDERYRQDTFELFDSWVQTFLGIWRETGKEELPAVAIVDFLEKGSSAAEFTAFREAFERAGLEAYVAEIRDMRYEDGSLMTADGHRIDAVYRRAVTSDILAHRDEVQAFLQAARDRKVCLIGDFCTQVVHDKVLFRILHDPYTAAFLAEEDNAFIAAHVPYTAMLTREEADRSSVRENRERWIIKPRDSYGAHGIYPGRLMDEEEWTAQLDARADTDYILQEFVQPYRTDNIFFGEENPRWKSFSNMTGVYLYGGHVAGIYSRASVTPIISVEGDEHEMTTIVLKKRNR